MPPKRRAVRRPKLRKPRRRAPRKNPVTRGMLKVYRYKFKLDPQILVSSLTLPGVMEFAPAPSGQVPFVTTQKAILPSQTGLPYYYDIYLSAANALTDIRNIAPFTALYDMFKIEKVHLQVQILANSAAVNGQGLLPTIYYWIDRDDAVTPTTFTSLLGKQGVRKWQPTATDTTLTISYTPAQLVGVPNAYPNTSVFTAAAVPAKPMWLNNTQGNVPGFGIKLAMCDTLMQGTNLALTAVRLNWTYDIAFRSPLICT